MIKKYKVLLRNDYVMVVELDGNKIQLPTDGKETDVVFVKSENEKYSLVDEKEYIKSTKQQKVKETKLVNDVTKKSTVKTEKIS